MNTSPAAGGDDAATVGRGSENCLPVGTRLSDFEITGILGEGGFGIVYIAYDHSLHRTVAIKEYMPSALAMRGGDRGVSLRAERHQDTFRLGLKSFINEARFLAQFDHPSLVKVYRFWEQNRTAYTAMKYYEGRTIKEIVAESPELIDEAWCRKILRQILEALEMLYTMQILHRDVAPDNIIIQENGDAVLLDFGSARQIIGDMTKGLTVILKPGYAPVEQYAGDASLEQGAFTDIYALAAVMYFAIVKQAPASSIARMIKDPITPLALQAPEGYSPSFLAAIDKGLAVLAQDRPQTIDAFRELLGIVSSAPPPVRAAGTTQRGLPPVRADAPPAAIPMPVGDEPAPAQEPAVFAPPPARGRWPFVAGVATALTIATAGLYALVHGAADDTIMVAQQHVTAPVTAPSKGLDPTESVVEVAPPLAPAPAPAPAPVPETPAAVARPVPAVVETVSYTLAVKPWGTVYVDGRERGVTPPMKKLVLPAGKHRVRIVNPSFPEYSISVSAAKNKNGTIEHDFAAAKK
ncbi:protein kinase [Massilia sp. R2A-15]|uniref:protein kinase domain-containing protein n=1 Tax=Massilia sp. R2A-15 TaxID=3064278 RepID=UPI0027333F22|nr:protein kinase [Massilia sp. R2A-15]WLI91696.1 protein kinase [Massilia sp. R2A-15]